MVRPASWRFAGLPGRTADERLDLLASQLQDLESFLDSAYRDLAFGPLDSQYVPINLGADESAGTALTNTTLDRFTFPFEATVAMVQLYCLGGNASVNLTYGSGLSVFGSPPISLTGGSSVFFNESTDFAAAPQKVSGNLTLVKVSTLSGTPHRIRARVILKGVSQIEST